MSTIERILADVTWGQSGGTTSNARYADEDAPLDAGFYEGRILAKDPTRTDAYQDFLAAVQRASNMVLALNNQDGGIDSKLTSYRAHDSTVTLFTGAGETKASYTQAVAGYIRHPGGVKQNRSRVELQITDLKQRHDITIPQTVFTETGYANADPSIWGKPIPIVYGDFADPMLLPTYCINKNTRLFKIAHHALSSIGSVFYEGFERNLEYDVATYANGKSTALAQIQVGIENELHQSLDLGTYEVMDGCQFGNFFYVVSKDGSSNGYLHKFDPASGWSQVHSWSGYYPHCMCVAIGKLYVGCSNGKIYHRDTGDTDWSEDQYYASTPDDAVYSMAADGTTGLYACTYIATFSGELYERDSEDSWHVVSGYSGNDPSPGSRAIALCLGYLYIGRQSAFEVIKLSDETQFDTRSGGCFALAARAKDQTDTSADDPADIYFSVSGALLKYTHGSTNSEKTIGSFASAIGGIVMDESGAYISSGAKLYHDSGYRGDFEEIDSISDVIRWLAWYDCSDYDSDDEAVYLLAGSINSSYAYVLSKISSLTAVHVEADGLSQDEPTDVIEDLLKDYAGAVAAEIDSTSKTAVKNILTNSGSGTCKCHGHIASPRKLMDVIAEICRDFGVMLHIEHTTGKYYFRFWRDNNKAGATVYTAAEDGGELDEESWDIERAPHNHYFNRITANWKHSPADGSWHGALTKENTTAQGANEDDVIITRHIDMPWRYDASDYIPIGTYLQNVVNFFSTHLQVFSGTIYDGATLALGSTIKITIGHLSAVAFQIRSITRHLGSGKGRIMAWDITNLTSV